MFIRKRILRVARFLTAVSVVASLIALLTSGGCGKGIFPEVTPTAVTITPTPVANAFLYATNFTDGTVSAFARNTNTGTLSFISKRTAGSSQGPVGIAVKPQNDVVYVANASDGRLYPFQIVQSGGGTPGDLTALTSISSGVTPQMVAIDTTGQFVYVTNSGSRTISEFSINSDGTLTSLGVVSGFGGRPFGITVNPNGSFLYVDDATVGVLYTYSIASNGVLQQVGSPVNSNGSSPGQPGLMAIVFDGSQGYLFVDDMALGVVSTFLIQTNGTLAYSNSVGQNQSTPIGIGAVNGGGGTSNNYVFTANSNGDFVQPFLRLNGTQLTQQTAVADSSGPTGLVIDSAGLFIYTGNSGNGTIAQIGINNSLCTGSGTCLIQTFNSESPANSNAGTQFLATTTP